MRCLFFVVFVYAVRCQDGNYYVIQVPRNDAQRTLKVYWNVPTMQCKSKKVPFENLYQKYGIYQNDGDQFRGEKVTIMYDPGLFPALLKNETSGKFKFRNGGVPQEGDLDKHLEAFRKDLDLSIPNTDFKGIGIIDFESWRPIYRQNFGVLSPYKDVSYEIERKLHWWWSKSSVEAEAKRRFESSARTFMERTISLARQLRPGGVWGFYGFPYCFNMASNNMVEGCANKVPEENDRLSWLWRSSTALYPSVYSSASLSTSQLTALIRGRVREARRVKRGVVLPYFWYRYRDGGFLTQTDLNAALNVLYKSDASGFIIWGSSNDVNTVDKCKKLYNYVHNIFGPAVAKYTKKSLRDEVLEANSNNTADDYHIDENNNATIENIDQFNKTTTEELDVSDEIHFVNKWNSTDELNSTVDIMNRKDNIKKDIKTDIIKKFTNYVPINEDNTNEEEEAVLKNNNVLIDLIINSILNKEFSSLSNNNHESTMEYNLINAVTESSLSTKNNVENTNDNIDENNNNKENQSTIDKSIVSTTEPIKVTKKFNIQTIDLDNSENHKETTQIDTSTEYHLYFDMLYERSSIEKDLATENAVTNSIYKSTDFNFIANDVTDRSFDVIDFTTTRSTKTTSNFENNEQDEFFNANTFTINEITTTENTVAKNSNKDIFRRINIDIDRTESEFEEIDNENKYTEKIKEKDTTTSVTSVSNYPDIFDGTKSIETVRNSAIITTESQNMNTESNYEVDDQETTISSDFDETSTTSTEDYVVFDETTITPIVKDESKNSIEDSTILINSQETINYDNFDNTTATPITLDRQNLIEDSTAAIVNNQETKSYTNFDETTATSIGSPMAENKSTIEDSTAVSATENKVSSSSRIKRSQYIYCIIFYIYSVKNCICSVFGQCS